MIYGYICDGCGNSFDVIHEMIKDPEIRCPQCDCLARKEIYGGKGGIHYKGNGFYTTDN